MPAQVAQAVGHEPTLAELMDPLVLEGRLAEARARRVVALARMQARLPVAGPRRRPQRRLEPVPMFFAGVAGGLAVAALVAAVLGRAPAPPAAWVDAAAAPLPSVAGAPTAVASGAPVGVAPPGALAPLAAAAPAAEDLGSLRPAPRPDGLERFRLAVRSERNRPAAPGPARVVGNINRATIGAAAGALGVRERLVLPGLVLSLDRRGLRLRATPARGRSERR